jgi:hypothetical protein
MSMNASPSILLPDFVPKVDSKSVKKLRESLGTARLFRAHSLARNKKAGILASGLVSYKLVAGARYVPNTQLLSIPFRSDLIHGAV